MLAPGELFLIDITVLVDPAATDSLTNVASLSSDTADPDPSDNIDSDVIPVTTSADVSVTKLADVAEVSPGEPISYIVTVLNSGPSDAVEVTISDDLPAGVVATNVTGATCALADPLTCDLGTLEPGERVEIVITAAADPAALESLDNGVFATSTTDDPEPGNNSATTSTPTSPEADVAVVTTGPASVVAGAQMTYTVIVTNEGPSDAINATLIDLLPTGTSLIAATPSVGGSCVALTCVWSVIPAGSSVSVSITVEVSDSVVGGSVLVNTASATSDTTDPNPTNDFDTHETTVSTSADLRVAKVLTSAPLEPGTAEIYTITVTNLGPTEAHDVVVADSLPSGLSASGVSSSAGRCTHDGVSAECDLGTVGVDETVVIIIDVDVAPGVVGDVSNSASVTSSTIDRNPSDNADTTIDRARPSADVSLSKSVGPNPFRPGSPIEYTLTIANLGPADAVDVVVTDPMPSGVAVTSLDASSGLCDVAGGVVACDVGTMAPGDVVTVTVEGSTDPGLTTHVTNTATVTTVTPDPVPFNNVDTATTSPAPAADLSIVKTAASTVAAGETLVYDLTISNAGPSTAPNVVVTDALPDGVTFVSADARCGEAGGEVTCTLGTMRPGVTVVLEVVVDTPIVSASTIVENQARVDSDTTDPDPSDNVSSTTTTVTPRPGTLVGLVWNDLDADGIRDVDEPGIPGVVVTVIGESFEGTRTVTTGPLGEFSTELPPGEWTVEIDQTTVPFGLMPVTPTSGIVIIASDQVTEIEFGEASGSITGRVWSDVDSDGKIGPFEGDISNVVVRLVCPGPDGLMDSADDMVYTAITASTYTFTGVPVGQACKVIVDESTVPQGLWVNTYDLDGDKDGITSVTVTLPGGRISDVDFGYASTDLPELALTGSSTHRLLGFAFSLVVAGLFFLIAARRRREQSVGTE
jgi:uncharacterized repeat protein (TIGR01451 family)